MEFDEIRFKNVGLSTDRALVFCQMDNGATYAMPVRALERAQDWDHKAKPKSVHIIHDGYAALVEFNTGLKIDFPTDFVLHVCEPSYGWYRGKDSGVSDVGRRIRDIRRARGLTLDKLACRCGIAKPNLSRLENDKVTPTLETLKTVAAALDTHPALLVSAKKPEPAWTWTRHAFAQWKLGLLWKASMRNPPVLVRAAELVKVFLATRPEHRYARAKLLRFSDRAPQDAELQKPSLDAEKWACELAAAKRARQPASRGMIGAAKRS